MAGSRWTVTKKRDVVNKRGPKRPLVTIKRNGMNGIWRFIRRMRSQHRVFWLRRVLRGPFCSQHRVFLVEEGAKRAPFVHSIEFFGCRRRVMGQVRPSSWVALGGRCGGGRNHRPRASARRPTRTGRGGPSSYTSPEDGFDSFVSGRSPAHCAVAWTRFPFGCLKRTVMLKERKRGAGLRQHPKSERYLSRKSRS